MITIVTMADKRPDFIKMQFNSIQKHVKNDFKYVVLNNDITRGTNYQNIHQICNDLNIECYDIEMVSELQTRLNVINSTYTSHNHACVYSLLWMFEYFLKDEKIVCLIDSDMFFIKDIDFESTMADKPILYTPHYRRTIKYIWPGFFCFNLDKMPNLKNLNWNIADPSTLGDVGSCTHDDIIKYGLDDVAQYVYEYALYDDIKYLSNNVKITQLQVNGCINYNIYLDNESKYVGYEHIAGCRFFDNKSFPHEPDFDNYGEHLASKINKILDIINSNSINLPSPIRISFLELNGDFFILHYQNGSNYHIFSNPNYNQIKTSEILKLL